MGRVRTVTWPRANALRLARHRLTTPVDAPDAAALAGVARAAAGIHAQIPSAAEVSLARRTTTATRADVRAALWDDDATLVRTMGPRGTVHLHPAADLPLWSAALSAIPWRSGFPEDIRLTADQTDEVVAAVGAALAEEDLTVDELGERVVATTGPWAADEVMPAFGGFWPRWRQALHTAAHRGALCFGPDRGRRVTYSSPARRWPDQAAVPAEVGVAHVVTTYLRAFGPGTPAGFARWIEAPVGWATEAFAAHAGEEVRLAGAPGRLAAGDPADDELPRRPPVLLLPYFDAFVVGSQPRDRLYPGAAAGRALSPSGQAGNVPVVLVDGVVGGVWHQKRSGRKVAVTVEVLGADLSARHRRALDVEVERLGAIVEATPTLTLGPVTVGPHA